MSAAIQNPLLPVEVAGEASPADNGEERPDEGTGLSGPDAFRLAPEPPRVMRLSRKALAILGGAAGIAIAGALLWALRPTSHEPPENLYDASQSNPSDAIASAPKDYGAVPKLGPPLPGDLGRPIVSAQQGGENIPVPPVGSTRSDPAGAAAAAGQERQRAAQEREAARSSRIFGGSSAAVAAAGESGAPEAATSAPGTVAGGARRVVGSAQPIESLERIEEPSSPLILQAGSVVPAALVTGIQSDLPGQVTAQVTQNVYDSPSGRHLLIPQGARLIGTYDSNIEAGQGRLLLAWDRLILPGGKSIRLEKQPGADVSGMAGLADRTDYHWGRLLKAALVSSLLGIGAELGANSEDDLARALREGTQDTINQTGRRVVEREIGVAPTIRIRPGFEFRVIVTRDLIFEPQGDVR